MVDRTRPKGKGGWPRQPERKPSPVRTVTPTPAPTTYPGCCKPYPDATFINQTLVRLDAHHTGPRCGGYREPMNMEDWHAAIDERRAAAARSGN